MGYQVVTIRLPNELTPLKCGKFKLSFITPVNELVAVSKSSNSISEKNSSSLYEKIMSIRGIRAQLCNVNVHWRHTEKVQREEN